MLLTPLLFAPQLERQAPYSTITFVTSTYKLTRAATNSWCVARPIAKRTIHLILLKPTYFAEQFFCFGHQLVVYLPHSGRHFRRTNRRPTNKATSFSTPTANPLPVPTRQNQHTHTHNPSTPAHRPCPRENNALQCGQRQAAATMCARLNQTFFKKRRPGAELTIIWSSPIVSG